MINVRKVKAAGLCDCCDKKKATYEVYCRISLGSFFYPKHLQKQSDIPM